MDTDNAATWLSATENQCKLCDKIGSNAEFKARTYNVIAFNVSLSINPDNLDHCLEICEVNGLERDSITSAKWAKAVEKRSANQRTAHLILSFNNADAVNRSTLNGMSICNRRCSIEKLKREPIRCLKCQGWGHFAKDCIEHKDRCSNCAGEHRADSCIDLNRNCASCNTNDHTSWSRTCPAFLKKLDELNSRNPDNLLQVFPTADLWSWAPAAKLTPPQLPHTKPSQIQHAKRQQQAR